MNAWKRTIGLSVLTLWGWGGMFCDLVRAAPREITTDLLIVGGTESGWAAAIQAARMGVRDIVIVHDGEWLGGQFTEQALACVDENKGMDKKGWGVDWHPMRRSFNRSGLFRELMDRIEGQNIEKYGSAMPGLPWHGPSTFRPAEAEAAFRALLQPYLESGQVRFLKNRYPVSATVDRSGDRPRLTGIHFAPVSGSEEADLSVSATITIDASDWGEAIQVSGTAFECGPDPSSRYGEPSALDSSPSNEMNPITWAMILVQADGPVPIPKPPRFDDRNYPRATRFSLATFRDLPWDRKPGLGAILHWPDAGTESKRQLTIFTVRRIVDGYSSKDGQTSILMNYMNGQDYPLERLPKPVAVALEEDEPGASEKNIVLMTRKQREIVFRDARNHSLGVLYHLQNFVHDKAPDKTNSFRNYRLSGEFGTPDNLPPKPYIRESLRLRAMYMMREQDSRNRDGLTKNRARPRFASVMYPDGLFAWQFHYDFHRTGRTYLEGEGTSGPWIDYHKPNRHTKFISDRSVFPLRSLIPEEMEGLVGAQGNVGFSSIVSAAIRLHDQRIHIGQAAGATAAVSLEKNIALPDLPYQRETLEAIRDGLCGDHGAGVPLLLWPFRDLDPHHPGFISINRLAALDLLPLDSLQVDFHPDDPAEPEWTSEIARRGELGDELATPMESETRGNFCQRAWKILRQSGWDRFALVRHSPDDADLDGIPDREDPLPFTPNEPIKFTIEKPELTPAEDGIPGDLNPSIAFDFCGPGIEPEEGFTPERGDLFDEERGYGWTRDLRKNHRKRNRLEGARDSFVFTREKDRWEWIVPNGRYRVVLCVGDSGHDQNDQSVFVEGRNAIDRIDTWEGGFSEAAIEVEVEDGKLTIDIGSGIRKTNTCLNWIQVFSL